MCLNLFFTTYVYVLQIYTNLKREEKGGKRENILKRTIDDKKVYLDKYIISEMCHFMMSLLQNKKI